MAHFYDNSKNNKETKIEIEQKNHLNIFTDHSLTKKTSEMSSLNRKNPDCPCTHRSRR